MRSALCAWPVLVALILAPSATAGPVTTLPGDGNLDWSVDLADLIELQACLSGPGSDSQAVCLGYDLDADQDVDLRDFAVFQRTFTGTQMLLIDIQDDGDDGTAVDDSVWHADGYLASGVNRMGLGGGESYDLGLRFHVSQVIQGETFAYARLVLPASDDGQVDCLADLSIVGIDADGVGDFSIAPPWELPKDRREHRLEHRHQLAGADRRPPLQPAAALRPGHLSRH